MNEKLIGWTSRGWGNNKVLLISHQAVPEKISSRKNIQAGIYSRFKRYIIIESLSSGRNWGVSSLICSIWLLGSAHTKEPLVPSLCPALCLLPLRLFICSFPPRLLPEIPPRLSFNMHGVGILRSSLLRVPVLEWRGRRRRLKDNQALCPEKVSSH